MLDIDFPIVAVNIFAKVISATTHASLGQVSKVKYIPVRGIEPRPPPWERGILSTRPYGTSLTVTSFFVIRVWFAIVTIALSLCMTLRDGWQHKEILVQNTRARPGFELRTSRTQSENHTPRPSLNNFLFIRYILRCARSGVYSSKYHRQYKCTVGLIITEHLAQW